MTRFFLRLKKNAACHIHCVVSLQVNTLETIKQTKRRFRKEKKKGYMTESIHHNMQHTLHS